MWTPSGAKYGTPTVRRMGLGWRITAILTVLFAVLAGISGTRAYAGGGSGGSGGDTGNHYGTLYVLCQKVGEAPGWKIVVSQNNDANNQNRWLLDTTTGISVQDARDKYDAAACNKFNPPEKTKVTAVDGKFANPCGPTFNLTFTPATTVGVKYVTARFNNTLKATAEVTDSSKYELTNPNWSQTMTDDLVACSVASVGVVANAPTKCYASSDVVPELTFTVTNGEVAQEVFVTLRDTTIGVDLIKDATIGTLAAGGKFTSQTLAEIEQGHSYTLTVTGSVGGTSTKTFTIPGLCQVVTNVQAVFPDATPATCTVDGQLPATPVTVGVVYTWVGNTLKAVAASDAYNLTGPTSRTYTLEKATGYQSTNPEGKCYKAPGLVDVQASFPDATPATCTADGQLPATPVTTGVVYSWTGNTLNAAAAKGFNLTGPASRTYNLAKATGFQSTDSGAACYKAPEVATPVVTSTIPDVIPGDGITPWYSQVGTWIGFGVGGFGLLIIASTIGRIRVRRGTTTEA